MNIAKDSVALFHYTLTNAKGAVLDSSSRRYPSAYTYRRVTIQPRRKKAIANQSQRRNPPVPRGSCGIWAIAGRGFRGVRVFPGIPRKTRGTFPFR